MDGVDWGDVPAWVAVALAVAIPAIGGWLAWYWRRRHEAEEENLPPWNIEPVSKIRYALINHGKWDTFDVTIEGARLLVTGPSRRQWPVIPAGENEEFGVFDVDQPRDDGVVVTWSWEPGGEELQYRRDLPRI